MPLHSGDLGWRSKRIMESRKVFSSPSIRINPGTCACERTVRTPDHISLFYRHSFMLIHGFRWYCEPAYEKLRGTDEGKVNSRLYSEKAYVLSRGFIRRALEMSLGGMEDVVKDIYITRGKLARVIRNSRSLIERSRSMKDSEDIDSDLAVSRLTEGGIIPLSRILEKLEALLAASNVVSS